MNLEADFVELQEHLYYGLLSESLLSNINVVLYRKLRLGSEINLDAIWQTPRNGKAGCGILVEMPALRVLHPNVSGPPGSLEISCAVLEEPNSNFSPAMAPANLPNLSRGWCSIAVTNGATPALASCPPSVTLSTTPKNLAPA
jgi:hypothetical protein